MACWNSDDWPEGNEYSHIGDSPWRTAVWHANGAVGWGVGPTGRAERWHCGWPEIGGSDCDIIEAEFVEATRSCGLLEGGLTQCWGNSQPDREAPIRHIHGNSTLVAFEFEDGEISVPTLQTTIAISPDEIVRDVAPIIIGACMLYDNGTIDCDGMLREEMQGPVEFDNPPYRLIASGGFAVCAVRDDWIIECHNGETFDFGPIHELAVRTDPLLTTTEPGSPPMEEHHALLDYSICVITHEDTIECVGPRYPVDLLEHLETDAG